MFKEVEREILRRITLAEEIRAVLRELAAGSAPDGQPPIPPETELRQVFLDPFGILYLDFSKAFLGVISTLGVQPHLAVSAIVMTLTLSFSEIKRVQFLVDGQEINFVSGALDLRRPVGLRFPGEEVQPTISQPPE
jgi:hypothetical protein